MRNEMSLEMTIADLIWNRAAMENGGESPASGDVALASLLYAHGMVMNGGLFHAVELLTADELSDAKEGFSYFGLAEVARLLSQGKTFSDTGASLEEHESRLDGAYLIHVPDDSSLVRRLESRLRTNPEDFSPIR